MATYTGKKTVFDYLQGSIPDGDHVFSTTANGETVDINVEMINFTGDVEYTASPVLGNTTTDQRMLIVKYHKNLTVGTGVTITPQVRKRGMLIFVRGVLTNNGTITMTARGAAAAGQNVYMFNDVSGSLCYIPADGAAAKAQPYQTSETGGHTSAAAGNNGTGRQLGGGGPGAARGAAGGTGAAATSFSGGSGGGGSNNGTAGSAAANGGAGGAGYSSSSYSHSAGGGAGNPGGAAAAGNRGDAGPGGAGTGGLLIIYGFDVINNGTISANGSAGGNGYRAGGGGSGGGHVELATSKATPTKAGTITVAGGTRGVGTRGDESGDGGSGGSGTYSITQVKVSVNKYLFQDGLDIKKYAASSYPNDVLPAMTANNNPSPYLIKASSIYVATNDAWKAFNNTNADADDCWHSSNTDTGAQWLQIDLGAGVQKRIGSYAITTRNHPSFPQSPKNWILQGSNDESAWDNLHTVSGAVSTSNLRSVYEFSSNPNLYRYFRILISANYSSTGHVAIGEMELIEAKGSWTTIGTSPATKAMFDTDGMADLSAINSETLRLLSSTLPELLVWTDEEGEPTRSMSTTAVPKPVLVLALNDIDLDQMKGMNVTTVQSGAGIAKFILSADGGATWIGLGGTSVNISDMSDVKSKALAASEITAFTQANWEAFISRKIRVGVYLEQSALTDVASADGVTAAYNRYLLNPMLEGLAIGYDLVEVREPELFISRDDGSTWLKATTDVLSKLDSLPTGKSLRVKAVLKNGQELQGISYSWI
ncbi:discoidin domain-containing protein (plasmid) [Paenibacillus rhizovicinus]|uniref:Discoidin domain-containing protein n=1 Tax=Paenibacillus rhizovicinus TaxID=2704463 RepID=A0A6C0PCH8_9BACL|nr:discoidin domain-containing protein [Paenibacillus rhizovicinus]QHW35643.1 discoidin domain-containing protein [Paenibacillus rhizovicinus]